MSTLSVSGAVSGVDTASIINSLVSVQQNQQTLLKTQQSKEQSAADTYGSLIASLGSLSTLSKSLANTSAWQGATATSSSAGVTATATGSSASAITFDVTSVAHAHTVISNEAVSSLGAVVASSGSIDVTKGDGTTATIAVGSGSLSDTVAAINASSTGLTAAAVQTAPGSYRLQISSATTGSASSFSVAGLDGFTAMNVLTQGTDAQVTVGTDPATQYTATSSTNTFASLVPGLSFTVSKPETGVTVSSTVDGTAVAGDVQKLVDAANSVLTSIASATAWNATTKTGGPLTGDSTARSLQQSILNMVSGSGAPGVSVTRDGAITFDQTAFTAAFAKDPKAVAAKFGATTSFTPAAGVTGLVSYSSSTSATRPGTYALSVSALANREQWDVQAPAAGQVLALTRGTTTVSYTVGATDTAADVVTNLNAKLSAAGFGVSASAGGSGILLTANTSGTLRAFTASLDGTDQTQLTAGSDVQGTIDGQPAVGVGSVLSLSAGTGGAIGLAVDVGATQSDLDATGGAVGSVTYTPGLAQRFTQLVEQQTTSGTGLLASAQAGRLSQVKTLQDQIDNWDTRLTAYRATLTTQFTAMETAIASLKSQSSFLTAYGVAASGSSGTVTSSSSSTG